MKVLNMRDLRRVLGVHLMDLIGKTNYIKELCKQKEFVEVSEPRYSKVTWRHGMSEE